VRQTISVVLCGVAEGESLHTFAKEFDKLIAREILIAWIVEVGGERLGDPKAMIGFSQQNETTVGSDAIITGEHLNGTIE
jgi:hypothetical protein